MQNLLQQLYRHWNQYKYRFVPWIAHNLEKSSVRTVESIASDAIISDYLMELSLLSLCEGFHKANTSTHSYALPTPQQQLAMHEANLQEMNQMLGFTIERSASKVVAGQQGVIVTEGTVPKGCPVCLYPGTLYYPYEPIFFQSLRNPFIFRCLDGLLIDGNHKGISKKIYRSCWHRDRLGPVFTCDASWLTDKPINPLAIGQFVNNHNKEYPANVAYQEFTVPAGFPFHLRQYLPNNFFTSSTNAAQERSTRLVILVSTKEIETGSELLSTYFTIIKS